MKKQLQCLFSGKGLETQSFRHEKCLAQPLQSVAAGAIEERDLDTSVAFALNYSTTVEGVTAISTGEGPGHVLSQSTVS